MIMTHLPKEVSQKYASFAFSFNPIELFQWSDDLNPRLSSGLPHTSSFQQVKFLHGWSEMLDVQFLGLAGCTELQEKTDI